MIRLTEQELLDKITQVEKDIKTIDSEKGRDALTMYLDYLKDELKALKNDNGSQRR